MTLQYGRKVQLSVLKGNAEAYDLSNLHIVFNVFSATVSTLKYAEITIWNLSKEKSNAIFQEFTGVSLAAGYEGQFGDIFTGQICRVSVGKENAVDSFVKIFAQDGDTAQNWCMTQATLSVGWTDDHLYKQLMTDFSSFGDTPDLALSQGYKPDFTLAQAPDARTLYGKTDDFMSELADRQNCEWFIEDGKVNVVPKTGVMPNLAAPILSSSSGIIGVPTLDINGISLRCLLNPKIRTGGAVHINNADIAQLSFNTQQAPDRPVFLNQVGDVLPSLQGQSQGIGVYKAHCVTHSGDTRGQEWYTSMIGVAIDATAPPAGPAFYDVPSGD